MKEKQEKKDGKVYDFRKCNEEVNIDVFVESDLSKALGNYIHKHTDDIGIDEMAREIYHKGFVTLDENMRQMLIRNIEASSMIVSEKAAILEVLRSE